MDAKGDWYYCDDSDIEKTEMSEDFFESPSAYLLFYY